MKPTASPAFRRILLLGVLLAFSGALRAQTRESLDNGWECYQGSLGSIWEIWRGDKATDNVTWQKVTLPHCFNARDSVDPDVRYYQGPGWYRTRLKISNPYSGGRTLLHFNGAGQKTEVYIGLEKVGSHNGGYDEWDLDITEAVAKELSSPGNKGEIPLSIRCDNSRDAEAIPSDLSDFNRYGGIYRHLYLVYVPAVSVERIHVEPVVQSLPENGKSGRASVKIRARLYNPTRSTDPLTLITKVTDPSGKEIGTMEFKAAPWEEEKQIAFLDVDAPLLWSPKTPSLYNCTVTMKSPQGDEEVSGRFGMKTAEWTEHGPFRLNGERLLLRGTHYHEDHAGVAAAVPDEVVRKTLTAMKEMGVNFVRLGHYQQAPLVLDLCDELGILAWEEAPWCRGGLGGEAYQKQALDMLGAMIDQHYNHPSIILWGMGNENDWPGDFPSFDKEAIRNFMAKMNAEAHRLDPSRKTVIRRCDFCKDLVDVYSPSIWAGWYGGRYTEYRAALEKWIKQVPLFFHAEYGGDSHARRHSEDPERFLGSVATGKGTAEVGDAYKGKGGAARPSKDGDWSESYIINLFDWHLREQEQMTNLTGSAQWIFKDFATPLRPENPVPRVNQKGLVERDGTPKESYYLYQSYWSDKPMIHIYGHTWPVRWGKPDEQKLVKVFSNCGEAELFVNGVSAGVKQRNITNYPACGLNWMVKFRPGENTLKAVGKRDGKAYTDEIKLTYQTEPWNKPAKLKLEEIGRTDNTVTLQARIFDTNGVQCLDAANLIRFGVTGDATLRDNTGTSTGSRAVQLYNGRAQIGVTLGNGGEAVVSVSSENIPTAFLRITAKDRKGGAGPDSSWDWNSLLKRGWSELKSWFRKSGRQDVELQRTSRPEATLTSPVPPTTILPPMTGADHSPDIAAIDRNRILKAADAALALPPISITQHKAKASPAGPNEYYSNGDYWWPDPNKPDGLPYVQRDGQTNPENFNEHRMALRQLRDAVAALGAAYRITGNEKYAAKSAELLKAFFLDPGTRMSPNLQHAQTVPGAFPDGRGIGIIDTLHLIEVPVAVGAMQKSPSFTPEINAGLKKWFQDYLDWMITSKNGKDEAAAKNNHSVAYWLQAAVFATFTGDQTRLAECRRQFKEVFLPNQMAPDGGFPLELKRTKPYAYSIFQLDNMTTLCRVLSSPGEDVWNFQLPDGRCIAKGVAYLQPYLADKSKWPLKPDVQAWEGWPTRQSSLLFAGIALNRPEYLELWKKLKPDPKDEEIQRNIAITQPVLWIR